MNTKTFLTPLLVLIGLVAATASTFFLGHLFPHPEPILSPGLPPLSSLDLPPQTINGFTAQLESYYADASRLVFVIRINSEKENLFLDSISIKEAHGEMINAGYGISPILGDPAGFMIDFVTAQPLSGNHLNGQLAFKITHNGDWTPLAEFQFDLDIPVYPQLTFNPKQTIWANGIEILLDRVVITPAYTQAFLCYIAPTQADWVIGQDTTLRLDSQVAHWGNYALLFDKSLGDGSKGGEPGWTPPVQTGRCVEIGFPIGSANPKSLTLTIPSLEQSMPEVIPEEDLPAAYERLRAEGIEMEWHIVDHGAYPEYKKLSLGMTEQEAYRQFIRALGYVHPGTWTFNIQLENNKSDQPVFSTSSYGAALPIPFPSEEPEAVTVEGRIRSFDLSPNLKTIAFATSNGIVLSDLDSKQTHVLNDTENFFSVDWSPDGSQLAAGSIRMNAEESGFPHVTVWDSATWEIVYETKGEQEASIPFGTVAWSPNGKSLAASLHERGLAVIDVASGKISAQLNDFLLPSSDLAWSPDGSRLLATGDLGFGFRRWRLDTNESVRLYDPRAGSAAIQLAWSPDGKRIASGHAGGTVCFWTVSTNQCDGLIYAHENMVSSLAWSPDGSKLATGGGVIRIWDAQTGQSLKAFGMNNQSIYTKLAWLKPDLLISLETGYAGNAPTMVRFWNLDTVKIMTEFRGASGMFGE